MSTVQDLINELSTYPPEREIVYMDTSGWSYEFYIGEEGQDEPLTIERMGNRIDDE